MPPLNWTHHILIQALLTRGPLKEKDFHDIFSAVTSKNPASHQGVFNDYLLKINRELSSFHFELRGCRDQFDGHVWYGVVNNFADEQSKLGTKYSVPQIAFYKAIIEAVAHDATGQGSITNINALNLQLENQVIASMGSQTQDGSLQVPAAIRNFSLSQKEKALDELVKDRWLCRSPEGNIGLGVRSYLDLRSWFHSSDIPSCEVCNEAVVKGELCKTEGCSGRIHLYCLKKFSRKRGEKLCPSCGNKWEFQVSKAEALDEDEVEEPIQSPPRTREAVKERKRRRTRGHDDTGSAGSTQVSQLDSSSRRVTRRSTRQR